jgi:hypothetical protein
MINGKSYLLLLVFFLSSVIYGQTDLEQQRYYRFVLSDGSVVIATVLFEDDGVIQIKSVEGKESRIRKSEIKKQSPIALDAVKKINGNNSINDSSAVVCLELTGGSELLGRIVAEDSTTVTINLLSQIPITVRKEDIKARDVEKGSVGKNGFWFEDPNSTRLLFGPTGKGLKRGEGYFAVLEVFFPMVAVGVADFVTLAGGLSLFPGMSDQLIYFAPKVAVFQNETFATSVGDFFLFIPDEKEEINIVYAVSTYTTDRFSVTGSVGYELYSGKPGVMLGGDVRISRYAKFISENWFFKDSNLNFASLGIRFMGKHLAADFALIIPITTGEGKYIPWVGFAYNF